MNKPNRINFFTFKIFIGILCLFFIWSGSLSSSTLFADTNQNTVIKQEYNINSLDEFLEFSNKVKNGNNFKNVIINLNCDIYLNTAEDIANSTQTQTTIIGNELYQFSGTFNGNGHIIYGVYCNNTNKEYFSLFGYINNATISNLKLLNVNITAGGYASALAYNVNNSLLSNIEVVGFTQANTSATLLVNNVYNSTIFNCLVNGTVISLGESGSSIATNLQNSKVINCANYANISSARICAGLVATQNETSCTLNCINLGSLTTKSSENNIGGTVGYNLGTITNCYYKLANDYLTLKPYGDGPAANCSNCASFTNANNTINVLVNETAYSSVLNALNAGAGFYSNNNMALLTWNNESSPTFSIQKQDNEFITSLSCNNITYGQTPTPTISAKFGTPYFMYSTSINGDFNLQTPINAGEYYVKAVVAETESFTGLESEPISFVIEKAPDVITLTHENPNKTYDGLNFIPPTATSLSNSTIYYKYFYKTDELYENEINAPTNAGFYTLKIYTLESNNYLSATKLLNFTIEKANLTNLTQNLETTYNNNNHSININFNGFVRQDNISIGTITYSTNGLDYLNTNPIFKNVGTYTVYYKAEFLNYNTITGINQIIINKANYTNITHPSLSGIFDKDKTLNNYALNSGFSWKDITTIPTCNQTAYPAIYNLDTTNYNDFELNITLTLAKQTINTPSFDKTYIYNGAPQTFAFSNLDSNLIDVSYFEKTNAGEYDVILYLKDLTNYCFENFSDTITIKFVINKASFENKSLNINYSAVYEINNTLKNYINILHEKYSIPQFYYFTNPNQLILAGENTIEMYYNSDPTNYNNYYFNITLNITKAKYDNLMLEYDSESFFTINEHNEYVFIYDGTPKNIFVTGLTQDMSANVIGSGKTEVGTYTITATITCNPNYETPLIAPLTYKIIKAPLTSFNANNIVSKYENNILKLEYLQGFDIKIKLNEEQEFSNSVYVEPINNLTVYYKITSKNYEDVLGTLTLNLIGENDLNNNNNNNNSNNNNHNNNTNNNTSENNTLPASSKNGYPIKNIILIIIGVLGLVSCIVIIVIKIRKRKY